MSNRSVAVSQDAAIEGAIGRIFGAIGTKDASPKVQAAAEMHNAAANADAVAVAMPVRPGMPKPHAELTDANGTTTAYRFIDRCVFCGSPDVFVMRALADRPGHRCEKCDAREWLKSEAFSLPEGGETTGEAKTLARVEAWKDRIGRTQNARKLTRAKVAAKLDSIGLDEESLDAVLALAVDAISTKNYRESYEELVGYVRAIRHVRTVLIGEMAPHIEDALCFQVCEHRDIASEHQECDTAIVRDEDLDALREIASDLKHEAAKRKEVAK